MRGVVTEEAEDDGRSVSDRTEGVEACCGNEGLATLISRASSK